MKNFSHRLLVCLTIFFFVTANSFFAADISIENPEKARNELIAYSKQFIGVPYVYGGVTSQGMDCSGFIYTSVLGSVQIQVPRTVSALYGFVRIIPDSQKEPGDILFFKTVSTKISHAAIYIGNNQFIHAASDGPNTGVIVSSLSQTYWKNSYAGVGQILPPTQTFASQNTLNTNNGDNSSAGQSNSFLANLSFDVSTTFLWSVISPDGMLLNARGGSIQAHAQYTKWDIRPGIGIECKFDPKMHIVQFPVIFSVAMDYGFRMYAGPVFTIGNPTLPGTSSEIAASIFPGVLGLSWEAPGWNIKIGTLNIIQDISWTVFNETDNSALSLLDSLASGLVFSTGVRVTIPGTKLLK